MGDSGRKGGTDLLADSTMKTAFAFLSLFITAASAIELTPENWDEKTAGKTVFIKFLAPW